MIRKIFVAVALVGAALAFSPVMADDSDAAEPAVDTAEKLLFPELLSVDGNATAIHPGIGEGKWTLVMLWATSCHICEIDKPLFSKFHEKHKEGDVTVFGISIDGHQNMSAVQNYLAKRDVSFPNSVGEFLTVGSSMVEIAEESLRGTPTYLLFNPDGEITGVHAGHLQPEKVESFIAAN